MMDLLSLIDYCIARSKGPLTSFEFQSTSVWTGYKVEKMLNQYGVRTYGRELKREGGRKFRVRAKQGRFAEELLVRAEVPLLQKLKFPKNEKYRGAGLPKRQWEKGGVKAQTGVEVLRDVLAIFFG